jgi:hypothetical protein
VQPDHAMGLGGFVVAMILMQDGRMDAWALERQEEYDTANGVIHKTPMSKAKMILMDSKKKTTVAN